MILTFGQVVTRFKNLEMAGLTIEEAIVDAVYSIYDMGKWPGTTKEIRVETVEVVEEADGFSYIYLDPLLYNGAIGFRSASFGFGIQDVQALYREKFSAGDLDFIDYGLVDYTVGEAVEKRRRYRVPLGFKLSNSERLYALVKRQPPDFSGLGSETWNDDAFVEVYSYTALKAAIMAVSFAAVGDVEREQFYWGMFDQRMERSTKQFRGGKKANIGVDSPMRVRPQQFM